LNAFSQFLKEIFNEGWEKLICAISEALRITKLGGYVGWIELSLKKDPTQEFLDLAVAKACAYCIQNALTFDGWKELFLVMSKWLFNERIRKRMKAIFNFFSNNSEYIGYGIYAERK